MNVSVIVTAFLEASRDYLDLCIESLKNSELAPKEVTIVSPASYKPEYYGVKNLHPEGTDYPNAHALNLGAKAASKDSDYLLFCNDDVIFTRKCLGNLVASSKSLSDFACVTPISNDQQRKYHLPVPYVSPHPYRIDQVRGHEKLLMGAESFYPQGVLFFESLCLFAALIPKSVYLAVGPFTEAWMDDTDWTKRAHGLGYVNVIDMSALCWHAGGATADITLGSLDSEKRKQLAKEYNEKKDSHV